MNIDAAEFKAKCLKLIDDVVATRRPLLITKRGKPVARIVPVGYMKGTGEIVGDVIDVPPEPWSAETSDGDGLYLPRAP